MSGRENMGDDGKENGGKKRIKVKSKGQWTKKVTEQKKQREKKMIKEKKQVHKILEEEGGAKGEKGLRSASLRNSFISLRLFGGTRHGVCHHRL